MASARAATVLIEGKSLTLELRLAEDRVLSRDFERILSHLRCGRLRAAVEKRTGPLH